MLPQDLFQFDLNKFREPDTFYWPGYMWIWNDELSLSELSEQLKDMVEHQAKSPMPVPEPKSFRPIRQPTRLEPEYLSPAYLELYHQMVSKAASLNMHIWLYDEGGWPSGSVCGALVDKYPSLKSQTLHVKKIYPRQGKTLIIPANCLCGVLIQNQKVIRVLEPKTTFIFEIPDGEIWIFHIKRQGNYPDLLNPLTTQKFLQMTHEQYASVIGDYFGKNVCITFTDEPKILKPVWTDDLIEDFRDEKGYDIRKFLPSLFGGEAEEDKKIRIDFYDWWSSRFAKVYFGQIQDWCHQHNLLSGGHLSGEDETLGAVNGGFGHVLRPLRKMDVPGIDTIWRQLWQGKSNHHFPKYASTAAHQEGHPWALSESFAVYGSGITPMQMKWVMNYQFVRGINLFDLATYQYSNKDWFIGGERPVMGPINPLWKYMSIFHSYIARLSYLLSLGDPLISIAVYYPVRDIWAGGNDANSAALANDQLVNLLQSIPLDFDFIDDDVIVRGTIQSVQTQKDIPAFFCVGPMKYSTICISKVKWLPPESKEKLEDFSKAGGKIYWIDNENSPKLTDELISLNLKQLKESLIPILHIEPPTSNVRVCIRQVSDGRIYFLTNEDTKPITHTITFHEKLQPKILDPETGCVYESPNAIKSDSGWTIQLSFPMAGSWVIVFLENSLPVEKFIVPSENKLLSLNTEWIGRKTCGFHITRHKIEVQSLSSTESTPISLGDWTKWVGKGFSGDIEYRNSFICSEELVKEISILDLGKVSYACEVILNNQTLGQRIWSPFTFIVQGKLQTGVNELKIIVTNTLANQYVTTRFFTKWSKRRLGPYHPKALKFERDSIASGLFGPVIFY
jgi:hypothetical protein